jgi:hypothetical protein
MDPIDRLVARLTSAFARWDNGTFPRIDLPPTATTEEVVASVLERVSFENGRAMSHSILRTTRVQIGADRRDTLPFSWKRMSAERSSCSNTKGDVSVGGVASMMRTFPLRRDPRAVPN